MFAVPRGNAGLSDWKRVPDPNPTPDRWMSLLLDELDDRVERFMRGLETLDATAHEVVNEGRSYCPSGPEISGYKVRQASAKRPCS